MVRLVRPVTNVNPPLEEKKNKVWLCLLALQNMSCINYRTAFHTRCSWASRKAWRSSSSWKSWRSCKTNCSRASLLSRKSILASWTLWPWLSRLSWSSCLTCKELVSLLSVRHRYAFLTNSSRASYKRMNYIQHSVNNNIYRAGTGEGRAQLYLVTMSVMVQLSAFCASALGGREWSASHSKHFS